ncbi:MAG: integrase family protein [Alphaproteobacteria bacterium]
MRDTAPANLTELTIKNLKPPPRGVKIYGDAQLKGFGVRVTAKGTKAFVLTYGRKRRRVTLGTVGLVKLAVAQEKARDILAEHQLKGEAEQSLSFAEARELYLSIHYTQNMWSTQKETQRLLTKHFAPLDDKPLMDIGRREIAEITDRLKPGEANHAFTAVKALLRWSVSRGYIPHDPLAGVRKPFRARSRDRVLTDEELKAVLLAAPSQGVYGQIVQFLALTGQRRGQAVHLRGDFFDREEKVIRWPAELMKGNRAHTIPYGDHPIFQATADGLIFGLKAFTKWSDAHTRLLRASETSGWTLHDLRRTFATRLGQDGHRAPHRRTHPGPPKRRDLGRRRHLQPLLVHE